MPSEDILAHPAFPHSPTPTSPAVVRARLLDAHRYFCAKHAAGLAETQRRAAVALAEADLRRGLASEEAAAWCAWEMPHCPQGFPKKKVSKIVQNNLFSPTHIKVSLLC